MAIETVKAFFDPNHKPKVKRTHSPPPPLPRHPFPIFFFSLPLGGLKKWESEPLPTKRTVQTMQHFASASPISTQHPLHDDPLAGLGWIFINETYKHKHRLQRMKNLIIMNKKT